MRKIDNEIIAGYLWRYKGHGLNPIPLRGKVGAYHWKVYKFNIRDFFNPGVSIGIRTGKHPDGTWFYVVDIDSKTGLAEFYGLLPKGVPIVSTGKGWHLYLRWNKEVKTKHFAGLDVICGGYVVAPPSLHSSGKPYRFVTPLNFCSPLVDPEKFTGSKPGPIPQRGIATLPIHLRKSDLKGVKEGRRHNTAVAYLGLLFCRYFNEEDATAEMIVWNRKCQPPLPQNELLATIRSCWSSWDIYQK